MEQNNFEKELEAAQKSIQNEQSVEKDSISDDMRQIQALAQMDPEYANSKEVQDLLAEAEGNSNQAPVEEKTESTGKVEEEVKEEVKEEVYEEDDYQDDTEDDNDIFGVNKKVKKEKEVNLNFTPSEEMSSFVNEKYGVDDVNKFFTSVDTWRTQAQKGAENAKELELISNDLQALPPEIKTALNLWANGEDYNEVFKIRERLDFSEDFKGQDNENLVQHYLKEQYEDLVDSWENEEIDDDEFDDKINLLAGSTRKMFNSDKKALESEREQFMEDQKNYASKMKKSALLSVENLSKTYPNFSKGELSKVRNILVEGKVDNLFVNSDGTYSDDAAELIAYAMYGKRMMESVKKTAERRGESKANQKIVDSSPSSVRRQKSASSNRGINTDAVQHLSSMFKSDPYA